MGVREKMALAAAVTAALCIASFFAGFLVGYGGGFSSGWSSGMKRAWDEAYGSGYLAGWAAGNSTGFSEGYAAGESEGYKSGYIQGARDAALAGGFSLRDPAYDEVVDFLRDSGVDRMTYDPAGIVCLEYAAALKNEAAERGLRCGIAIVYLEGGIRVLNCFSTIDRGLIYVEPQTDAIISLRLGDYYAGSKVVRIIIVW